MDDAETQDRPDGELPEAHLPNFHLVDERGTPLLFGLHRPDAELPALAGIFCFMRVTPDAADPDAVRIEGPFHVGTAERFSDRGRIARRWDEAVGGFGATHIATRAVDNERSRLGEARSLAFHYDPPMRNAGLRSPRAVRGRPDAEPIRLKMAPGTETLLHARLSGRVLLPVPREPAAG